MMADARDLTELMTRATKRADGPAFLPYAIFEEISSPLVVRAARVCAFPLSLTDDLAAKLLDFASTRLGDMAPVLIKVLRSSNFVINGSGERWRYEQQARAYFLRYARGSEDAAKKIHKWLLKYYARATLPAEHKREAWEWTQQLREAYHRTPPSPEKGAAKYAELFEDYKKAMILLERVSTLAWEQTDWLKEYSVDVLYYQGRVKYRERLFSEAKSFFSQIHDREPLLAETRLESSAEKVHSQIVGNRHDKRRYKHVAVARHLLGTIIEKEAEYDDVLVETLYRDSLDIGRELEDKRHVAHVEKSLGDLLVQRGGTEQELAEARNLFTGSLEYEEDDDHVASVELSLGTLLFRKMGRNEDAIKHFRRGLEKAHKRRWRIGLRLGLGHVLFKGKDSWEAAEQEFAEARQLSIESQDTRGEIEALRGMLAWAKRKDDTTVQSRIQEWLSEAYLKRGSELAAEENWREANSTYRKYIRLTGERGDVQAVAVGYVELGRSYAEQGELELAEKTFERALLIDLDEATRAQALLGLGRVLTSTRRWDRAIDLLQDSLDIFSHLEDLRGVAVCNTQLGEAYRGLDRLGLALRRLEIARQLFEQRGEMYDAAKVARSIADILMLDHYSTALVYARTALVYARWGLEALLELGHEDAYDAEQFVNLLREKVAQTAT